jgi:hypothetical protein
VTTSLADRVSVFINRGDGSLSKRVEYRTGSGPRSVAIGDLNGDRQPDLVTANTATRPGPRPDSVSVFLNRRDGSFRARREYRAKGQSSFGPMAIGDLNRDAKLDAAIGLDLEEGTEPGRIAVLLGRGDGSFTRRLDYKTGPSDVWDIAAGDLNGDRKLDLAIPKSRSLAVLLNTTRG